MQSNSSKHHDFLIKRKLLQIQNKSISTKNIFGTIDARSKFHSKLLLKVDSPNAIKDKKLKKNQNSFNIQNNFTNNNIKNKSLPPMIFTMACAGIGGSIAAFPLFSWAAKAEVKASRKGRFGFFQLRSGI